MLAKIAQALMTESADSADSAADAVAQLIADLGLPQHLAAFQLGDEDLRAAAETVARRVHRPVEELVAIYRAAM